MDHPQAVSTVYEIREDFDVTTILVHEKRGPNYDKGRLSLEARPGIPLAERWVAQDFRELQPDEEGYQGLEKVADFFGLNYMGTSNLCFRQRALDLMGDRFRREGELLPATYVHNDGTREPIWIFRALREIDAIDLDHTIGGRQYGRRVSGFQRLALVQEKLADGVYHLMCPGLHCTDSFKNEVEAAGLSGLYFLPVWSTKPEVRARIMDWEKRVGYKLPPM